MHAHSLTHTLALGAQIHWSSRSFNAKAQLSRCYSHGRATTSGSVGAATLGSLVPWSPHGLGERPAPMATRHTMSGSSNILNPTAPSSGLATLSQPQHPVHVGGGSMHDGSASGSAAASAAASRWLNRSSSSGQRRMASEGQGSSRSSSLARGEGEQERHLSSSHSRYGSVKLSAPRALHPFCVLVSLMAGLVCPCCVSSVSQFCNVKCMCTQGHGHGHKHVLTCTHPRTRTYTCTHTHTHTHQQ